LLKLQDKNKSNNTIKKIALNNIIQHKIANIKNQANKNKWPI